MKARKLTRTLNLLTFEVAGMTLIKRMVWVVDNGRISHCFCPVFPPNESASQVIAWLSGSR